MSEGQRPAAAGETLEGVLSMLSYRFRIPSLRELRRKRPANVVILPTAQERQVQQRYNEAARQAKRDLRAGQSVTFPFKLPGVREAERQAQALSLSLSLELRADVPPFDPGNPAHLRAWEAIWDFGKRSWPSDRE